MNVPPGFKAVCTRSKNRCSPASPPFKWIHLDIENLHNFSTKYNKHGATAHSRDDYIIAIRILRYFCVDPVCGLEDDVMREGIRIGGTRGYWKRTEHMLARCREVVWEKWCLRDLFIASFALSVCRVSLWVVCGWFL